MSGFFGLGIANTSQPVSENRSGGDEMSSNSLADYLRGQLPDRHAQFADAYAAAAVAHPTTYLNRTDFALLHAGLIDRESFYRNGGWALRPRGPEGTGDPATRWYDADNVPDWVNELGLYTGKQDSDGRIEVRPPAYAGADVPGWGYGLGQIDFVSNRSWLDNNNWKDPFVNLDYSASILVGYIEQLGDVRFGVAAYNAGPNHNWSGDPDRFTSGKDYSRDVIARANNFGLVALRVA